MALEVVMSFSSQRGFTGLEILLMIAVAVALILFSGYYSSSSVQENNICLTWLNEAQDAMRAWVATVNTADPDGNKQLCQTAVNVLNKYNPVCGERTGIIPVPACGP